MTNLLVIAHRGASGYAPEHTFAAWDLALELGADYLEQDLQQTADGALVVLHDETLERTARRDGRPVAGPVSARTLAELRTLEVGSWFDDAHPARARPQHAHQRIATLDEVLERYRGRASFYIETKQPEQAPGMEEALLALLERHALLEPAAREWRVVIQSFSEASLRKLHALAPRLPLVRLLEKRELPALVRSAEYAVGIGPHRADVTRAYVAAAHAHCLCVHPYTANDAHEQRRLVAAGVDGMFTDFPDRLRAARPAAEPRGPAAGAAAAAAWAGCRQLSARAGPARPS